MRKSATRGEQQPVEPVLSDVRHDKRRKAYGSPTGSVRAAATSAAAAGDDAGSAWDLAASMGLDNQAAAAGPTPAVKEASYAELMRQWQQDLDQGELQLTEGALLQFAVRHAFVRRSAANLDEVKIGMTGRTIAGIASAAQWGAWGADWEQFVNSLVRL